MQVHCISISEHIWVGGCGPRGVGELSAGGVYVPLKAFFQVFLFAPKHRLWVLFRTASNMCPQSMMHGYVFLMWCF